MIGASLAPTVRKCLHIDIEDHVLTVYFAARGNFYLVGFSIVRGCVNINVGGMNFW